MPKTNVAGMPDDFGRWVALAAALAGVGILPKGWQKMLSAAAVVIMILKR